jgi:AcrR family transcriptional regulator
MTAAPSSSRRGRRPAGEDTRALIAEAARTEFAEKGYDATSMRSVARIAGVDPALVHHYFTGKADLFAEAVVHARINPAALIEQVLADGPREELGERLVRSFLRVWDDPEYQDRLVAVIRAVHTNEPLGKLFQGFILREIVGRVTRFTGISDAASRGALAASQIVGLATMRYVVKMEPIVAAKPEELAAWIGPTIQRYLVDPP